MLEVIFCSYSRRYSIFIERVNFLILDILFLEGDLMIGRGGIWLV